MVSKRVKDVWGRFAKYDQYINWNILKHLETSWKHQADYWGNLCTQVILAINLVPRPSSSLSISIFEVLYISANISIPASFSIYLSINVSFFFFFPLSICSISVFVWLFVLWLSNLLYVFLDVHSHIFIGLCYIDWCFSQHMSICYFSVFFSFGCSFISFVNFLK